MFKTKCVFHAHVKEYEKEYIMFLQMVLKRPFNLMTKTWRRRIKKKEYEQDYTFPRDNNPHHTYAI